MKDFKGKLALVVNVASACGLTPQYRDLQGLYEKYKDRGLTVLGFPCNQFGAQEPGDEKEIREFCDSRFQISFPMFSKVEVNGPGAHPAYQFLKENAPGGQNQEIEWNFAKFLVDAGGQVIKRFHPRTEPADIDSDIAEILAR